MLRSQWQSYLDQQGDQPEAGNGVCYLPELGLLQFSGPDVLNFLQGYLTCDTLELNPETLAPMAVCNLKGRVVVNGWCYRRDEAPRSHSVILIIHRSLMERVTQFLKIYAMFSKTAISDVSDATLVFGGIGSAGELDAASELVVDADHRLIPVSDLADAHTLWQRHPHARAASWWLGLIRAGIPLTSDATSEVFLPQMLDLERVGAVNFDKGCYLGQEVVARAQHRGEVKRRLQQLDWTGPTAPEPGVKFGTREDAARHLGTIITSVTTRHEAGACLAVLANDAPGPFQHQDTILNRVN